MADLKKLYIFEWFDDDFIKKITNSSEEKKFKSGAIIIKEWSLSNNAYILINGIVSVTIGWNNINTIFSWDIFGEIWLVMDEPRTATIQAETDIETLVINREILSEILKRDPDWDYIKATILNRIIQNNKK